MYKYIIVVLLALSSAVTPAWAGGKGKGHHKGWYNGGCFGGAPIGFGCHGWSGAFVSYGNGYGCFGGAPVIVESSYSVPMPISLSCVGGRFLPVSNGCVGGSPLAYPAARFENLQGAPSPVEPNARDQRPDVPRAPIAVDPSARDVRPAPTPVQPGSRPQTEEVERIAASEERTAPATLVVRLPSEAKLSINGVATRLNSDRRTFITPPLQPGEEFHYRLDAEFTRNGRTVTASHKVAVRAGEQKEILIEPPAESDDHP